MAAQPQPRHHYYGRALPQTPQIPGSAPPVRQYSGGEFQAPHSIPPLHSKASSSSSWSLPNPHAAPSLRSSASSSSLASTPSLDLGIPNPWARPQLRSSSSNSSLRSFASSSSFGNLNTSHGYAQYTDELTSSPTNGPRMAQVNAYTYGNTPSNANIASQPYTLDSRSSTGSSIDRFEKPPMPIDTLNQNSSLTNLAKSLAGAGSTTSSFPDNQKSRWDSWDSYTTTGSSSTSSYTPSTSSTSSFANSNASTDSFQPAPVPPRIPQTAQSYPPVSAPRSDRSCHICRAIHPQEPHQPQAVFCEGTTREEKLAHKYQRAASHRLDQCGRCGHWASPRFKTESNKLDWGRGGRGGIESQRAPLRQTVPLVPNRRGDFEQPSVLSQSQSMPNLNASQTSLNTQQSAKRGGIFKLSQPSSRQWPLQRRPMAHTSQTI